jgi:hypothetical protein
MNDNECSLGVGDGKGSHFVHGKYETIKTLQEKLLRLEHLEKILNTFPVVIETPYVVCDGTRIDLYQNLLKDYGNDIENWVLPTEDYKQAERAVANRNSFK